MKRGLFVALPLTLLLATLLPAHDQLDFQGAFPAPSLSSSGSVAFTSSGVQLMSWLTVADLDPLATEANDCWGYVSPSGKEYAIIGTDVSTVFVDVSDCFSPQVITAIAGQSSMWRDVKTYDEYAYSVSENSFEGIQVFDLTMIDSGTVTLTNTITASGCTDASHNVAINTDSGMLYRCGGSFVPCAGLPQGLVIYDLTNPASPLEVGLWSDKYVHDAQIVTWDIAGPHFGKEIAFCAANDGAGGGTPSLYILDVTDPTSISVIGSTTYSTPQFSHQVWLTKNKDYIYLNDELDEQAFGSNTTTRIIDVSDLTMPSEVGTFSPGTTSIDHNLYVKGDLVFEANYRSGLRVFDNSTPTAPFEIAYYDTYPNDDNASFNSLWSVYPFFPSETILGSDLEKGLFVWRLGARELTYTFPGGQPEFIAPDGGMIEVEVVEDTPGDLLGGTVQLHVDVGAGFVTVPMTSVGGTLVHRATVPSSTCSDLIPYYFSAKSTDGCTWVGPEAAPTQVYTAISALYSAPVYRNDVEASTGWISTLFNTATGGLWTHGDPIGTGAQPEDDHTDAPGTNCWFTGQGTVGGALGAADVDGGITTLFTPALDATGLCRPSISYWRWYSNNQGGNPGNDVLTIDISNDNGANWVNLETVGPSGPETMGGWIKHSALIQDYVTPTSSIRLRFVASDTAGESIIEAAIDDLAIEDCICELRVDSVSPTSGPMIGGNLVTILGDGFAPEETQVFFGGNPSPMVNVLGLGALVCRVPAAEFGTRNGLANRTVSVTVQIGPGSDALVGAYSYTQPRARK